MSNQPGSSTAAQPDQPARDVPAGADEPAADAARPASRTDGGTAPARAPGAVVLALLAVGWLAAMLWSTRAAITSAEAGVTAISLSAFALPGVISAALVAGAAVALAATNLLGRLGAGRDTLRFVVAVGAGLLVGLVAALVINLTYYDNATTNVIAGTTAATAVIGGALAGALSIIGGSVPGAGTARVVGAIVTAALGALVFVVAFSKARDPLFDLFGAGDTQQSLFSAAKWVSRTESLLAGLLAGLLAFGYLTWARRRAERHDPAAPGVRWPGYLLAGAGPGLLLLLAEIIIRVGGRSLLDLAGALSEADAVAQTSLGTSRIDNGIWMLFVGALTALIAFGRTLGPAPHDDEDEATEATADR
ncbi:hypothetical protein [Micromonospora sp. RTGN7]|uniref:hypothetical protein n=1 Tax=Micromonospora sp. RTGN7 TaxID=3016526 RepID=UPI0029FF40CF|nr:hypothetical protein [Micromonospora sp. RTGN7]